MNILVSSTPKHLKVTPTMIDDFLIDPVMGAKVIMGLTLDKFQQSRLRTYWWTPEVIDSSGLGTAKTFVFWVFINLRSVMIPDQVAGVYFQSFSAGQQNFWLPYYPKIVASETSKIFRAQVGEFIEEGDVGKAGKKGVSCWTYKFKNDSEVKMPAPSWVQDANTQAGQNFNVLGIDEWTKIVNTETEGIQRQLLGRLRRRSFNQDHPLWCNHQVFLAAAENMGKRSYQMLRNVERRIEKGDPTCAHISYNYKDYSNLDCGNGKTFKREFRDEKMFTRLKREFTPSHFMQEALGVWCRTGANWYSDETIERCIDLGRRNAVEIEIGRN